MEQNNEGIISKAITNPTVARAHNAFMMYHFKDYGGATKEAKEAGKDLYKRLKKVLKKESFVDGLNATKDMYKHPRDYFIKHAKVLKRSGSTATQHDLEKPDLRKGGRHYDHPLHKLRTILGHPDFHTTNKIMKDIHAAKGDKDLHKIYDQHKVYKESYVGDKEPDKLKDTSRKTKLKKWNQAIRAKRGNAGASENLLSAGSGSGVTEDFVDPKHYYHSYSDERLHDIVKKSGAAAKTSHRRGEGGTVGKFFDKEAETASAILAKRKRDKGWG